MIKSNLNFIVKKIENDIKNGLSVNLIKFRFPPEPNGYLHIGHIKAIYLNFELGKIFKAPVNLRFDDTNPNNIKKEFIDSIKKDIIFLGFKWDSEYYASDYFNQLYKWAIELIKKNKAYVDNQEKDEIKYQRNSYFKNGIKSKYRIRSVEENLYLFDRMKNGYFKEGDIVLRAKIDMNSPNINMRDPIMYRILYKNHYKTNKKWCIYPTYDWAHGQCDYIEKISHSLCSLEFENKKPLYNWFLKQVKNKINGDLIPTQIEFSRLNMSYSITSKRDIKYLINKKIINSWNDPRLTTISGLSNRGYTSKSLKNFIKNIGITKRNNLIDFSLLNALLKKDLNRISPRIMVVINPIKIIIDNYPDNHVELIYAKNHPIYEQHGYRKIPFSKQLYIEYDDFSEEKKSNFFRLYIGNKIRLKHAYVIKANYIKKNNITNNIQSIHCTYYPESKSGTNKNFNNKLVKSTLHWVSKYHFIPIKINVYDNLLKQKHIKGNIIKNKKIYEIINYNSKKEITGFSEPYIKKLNIGDHVQFQRNGYFYYIKTNNDNIQYFNKTISMK